MLSSDRKDRSPKHLELSLIWRKAVEAGQLASEFTAPYDDAEGRWKSGDKVLLGINHSVQGFCYSAKNLSTDKVIKSPVKERQISRTEFRCQLNAYRRLRPGGSVLTTGHSPEISPHSIECGFYCQNHTHPLSLLHRLPLAQIKLKNHLWNAYYNAVPLEVAGHFIWTPACTSNHLPALPHYLQTLDRAVIEDVFLLHAASKNFVLLFNSLHAGASVNHLHVHTVYRKHPLAIENQRAVACGRFYLLDSYPAQSFMFQGIQSVELVSEFALRLQESGIPFNLIWVDERVFLVPRNTEHEVTEELPFDTVSAMDICGKIVTTDQATYASLTKERMEAALRKSTIAATKLGWL